ncbi:hypothetical protein SAMN05444521_1455 [Streptomyces sp. 3214.6]|nr:hypothetical protein SAMN05444521_1455 [Streptomyces sp. 3214.6]
MTFASPPPEVSDIAQPVTPRTTASVMVITTVIT